MCASQIEIGASVANFADDTSTDGFGANNQRPMTTAAAVAIIAARIEKTSQICDSAEYTLIYDKQVSGTDLIAVCYQDDFYLMPASSRHCRCPVSTTQSVARESKSMAANNKNVGDKLWSILLESAINRNKLLKVDAA